MPEPRRFEQRFQQINKETRNRYENVRLNEYTIKKIMWSFGLSPEDWVNLLTDEDRRDIEEYYTNVSADFLQATGDYSFNPAHDYLHYVALVHYAPPAGEVVRRPKTIGLTDREQYLNPDALLEELYPLLFGIIQSYAYQGVPNIPLALADDTSREKITDLLQQNFSSIQKRKEEKFSASFEAASELSLLLISSTPNTVEKRMNEFEKFVLYQQLGAAGMFYKDTTETEYNAVADAFSSLTDETRDPHYLAFARRVFSGEFETNRRLFLDEVLSSIRSQEYPRDNRLTGE